VNLLARTLIRCQTSYIVSITGRKNADIATLHLVTSRAAPTLA